MAYKKAKKENKKEVLKSEELVVKEEKKAPTFIRMITPCYTHKGNFKAGQVLEADEELQKYFKDNAIYFEKLS